MGEGVGAQDTALARLQALPAPDLIDLSLDRMRRLCATLGNPQDRLPPVVHVAGTNGKGSTVAYLRAIGEAAGLRTHVYTSPHLVRFAERIRLGGALITDAALAEVLDEVEAAQDGQPATFFETTTAAAFQAFARTPADLCIVEVGLGGALDATNLVQPAVSVIAPIDLDHQAFLGATLAAVATEKAGIIKPRRPVVSARQHPEARAVIQARARQCGARLDEMGQAFDARRDRQDMLFRWGRQETRLPTPALHGDHQIANAGLAVAAALALGDDRITTAAIAEGVATATWPARLQPLSKGRLARRARAAGADLWLDGGHNPHAGAALAQALGALSAKDGRPIVLVAGLLAQKDAKGFFAAFSGLDPVVHAVGFTAPGAASAGDTARQARAAGLRAQTATSVEAALGTALAGMRRPRVLICGSLHLAGEVLAAEPQTWPT